MRRVCFTLQVRPDRLEEYKERHAAVWPDMLEALAATGWQDYSLFLRADGLLVGYLEAEDFAAAQDSLARTEASRRWEESMAEFFVAQSAASKEPLEEVFHLEEQLARVRAGRPATARPGAGE
ncbi:L-rhamnose mutarotase [Motilibacter rhizosphaerae]|uniref:L-rhamnose mutarotase n=1 Tax=Motilibacter rhizosphaerae TaxID=598652 RepID=A0A4V2F4Z7_9ACTN|nr:L-rhamnose mutarotase [Motilibacter rhizosphaerae]RZS91059.1 L-rhamnose mutarotase [Motilibacter rhizosphaerae]